MTLEPRGFFLSRREVYNCGLRLPGFKSNKESPVHSNHPSFRTEKVEHSELQYDMLKGLSKRKIPIQTLCGLISSPLLCRCQCQSLLCFHLSALGRKPEGGRFKMEDTSGSECSLSKLKISLRQPPPPSHCHFYFLSLSLWLCLPFES